MMAAARFSKDSDGRTRYRGQGKRGGPSIVRAAIGSLGLAIKSLKAARDHLTRVELENPDRMQRDALIAEARSQVRLGIGLASEAMTNGLPAGTRGKIRKTSGKQLGLALAPAK